MERGRDDRSKLERLALQVIVADDSYDVAVDTLWQFGPDAVSEQQGPAGTVLLAGFRSETAAQDAAAALEPLETRLVPGDDGRWLERWRAAEPTHRVGPFELRLPEHGPHRAGGVVGLTIEPSTTFGFSHASTLLALVLLAEVANEAISVADIGSGSGVLGIAAALLGAGPVHAVDIDPHAVEVTDANARVNDVDIVARVGSVHDLPSPRYELVLLNVTSATSSALAEAIVDIIAPGGALIVSGLLDSQRHMVIEAFATLTLQGEAAEAGWVAVHLAKP